MSQQLVDMFIHLSNRYSDKFVLNEWHLYGSSRIGTQKTTLELVSITFNGTWNAFEGTFTEVQNPQVVHYQPDVQRTHMQRGQKRYELVNHLGNVLVVISDKKLPHCVEGAAEYYTAEVLQATDYSAFGVILKDREYYATTSDKYRFGFNTQERTDEIAGEGNHYTAEFWEYDPRVVLRWNTDPKPHPSWSPYSIMQCNPIWNTDHKGDTVRTNSEGFENTTMAMEGILDGKANPIGFDANKGILTYDDKVDISGYSEFQKDVLGRYKELIGNKTDVNLKIVDINDKIEDAGGLSLNELNAAGITVPFKNKDGSIAHQNVYIARNPVKSDGSSEKKEYAGVTNIHELGGHSFLHLTQPTLKKNDHNKLVEDLHKRIFLNYKIDGAIWYKRSSVPLHEREEE